MNCRFTLASYGLGHKPKGIWFDSPRWWPDAEEIMGHLPRLRDHNGQLADQVENLRWYLRTAGHKGWTKADLSAELVGRCYQTQSLRERRGPNASYGAGLIDFQRAILNNLDLYEHGTFTRRVRDQRVVFTDCFPPDGQGWAPSENFDRLRRWVRLGTDSFRERASYTLSGLPVTVGGRPTKLAPMLNRIQPAGMPEPIRYTANVATPKTRKAATPATPAPQARHPHGRRDGGTAADRCGPRRHLAPVGNRPVEDLPPGQWEEFVQAYTASLVSLSRLCRERAVTPDSARSHLVALGVYRGRASREG